MIGHPPALHSLPETIAAEIACARRVAAMLTCPDDQATIEHYISELVNEAHRAQRAVTSECASA